MTTQIQKTVLFYGDELIAVQAEDTGSIFVPVSRLCENLGIERKRQAQRIRDHEVLSHGFVPLTIETPGGAQEAQCLRLDLIPLWLAGVNANRVSPDVRAKLVQYQAEAASVLWAAFRHDILSPADTAITAPQPSGAVLAYEIATAIQHLAQQQMELEQRLGGRMDKMALWARELDRRMNTLELQVAPQAAVTEQQAAEVALAVKAVGYALAERGTRSGYSQVYAEMYRRYGISSYKSLPQSKFDQVISWLRAWHEELTVGNHTDDST